MVDHSSRGMVPSCFKFQKCDLLPPPKKTGAPYNFSVIKFSTSQMVEAAEEHVPLNLGGVGPRPSY